MYGELFDIPQPDELVFISSFAGGEVFRSGCCFYRGAGACFTSARGTRNTPVYHHPVVRRVVANGVEWTYRHGGALPGPYRLENMPKGWIEEYVSGTTGGLLRELTPGRARGRGRHGESTGRVSWPTTPTSR